MMLKLTIGLLLSIAVSSVVSKDMRNWHVGVDAGGPRGTVLHGHANVPLHRNEEGRLFGTVRGSRVFGGRQAQAGTAGLGLQYQRRNGIHGGVDATFQRGLGTRYTGGVGGRARVGPGTLALDLGAARHPGDSRLLGEIGAKYNFKYW